MFSLVKFDYGELYVTLSKKVQIIQGDTCLVKYRDGAKYSAILVQRNDSEKKLKVIQQRMQLENYNKNPGTSTHNNKKRRKHDDLTKDICTIKHVDHSTPLKKINLADDNEIIPPKSLLSPKSSYIDESIVANESISLNTKNVSIDSSLPPSGASEILEFVGDSWLKDQSTGYNTSKNISDIGLDTPLNINRNEYKSISDVNRHMNCQIAEFNNSTDTHNTDEVDFTNLPSNISNNHKSDINGQSGEINKNIPTDYCSRLAEDSVNNNLNNDMFKNHNKNDFMSVKNKGFKDQLKGNIGGKDMDDSFDKDGSKIDHHKDPDIAEDKSIYDHQNEETSDVDDKETDDSESEGTDDFNEEETDEFSREETDEFSKEETDEISEEEKTPTEDENIDSSENGNRDYCTNKDNTMVGKEKMSEYDIDDVENSNVNDWYGDGDNFENEGINDFQDQHEDNPAGTDGNDLISENHTNDYIDNGNSNFELDKTDEVTANENDSLNNDSNYVPNTSASLNNSKSKTLNSTISTKSADVSLKSRLMDNRNLKVICSKSDNKRILKKDFCLFCKKLYTKLSRHLEDKHKNEDRVREFCYMTKGMKQRRQLIAKIRNEGNFLHNTNQEFNTGVLITRRQQQSKYKKKAEDYIPCVTCKGFFSKKTIRLHFSKCNPNHRKGEREISILGRTVEGYSHPLACKKLRKNVLPVLNDDDISRLIKYDELIILVGNKLCKKLPNPWQHDQIRASLRYLGKLKQALLEKNTKFTEFSAAFRPEHYDDVVEAIQKCAKFNEDTETFETPSVASTIGTLVKRAARIYSAHCLRQSNFEIKTKVDHFSELYNDDFPTTINKTVRQNQIKNKRKKKTVVPVQDDIFTMHKYLHNICKRSLEPLNKGFDLAAWRSLAEASLTLIQLFNRKRPGETERIEVDDFINRDSVNAHVDFDSYQNVTERDRELADIFQRITIRGKLGRTVPALLDKSVVNYIETILKFRRAAGVPKKNNYLFGLPSTSTRSVRYFRACNLMRKFSKACGARYPESLRGTALRKHVATYSAILGIEEYQIADLANFMGHSNNIHKDVYRVPLPMRDNRVSELLLAALGIDNNLSSKHKKSQVAPEPSTSRRVRQLSASRESSVHQSSSSRESSVSNHRPSPDPTIQNSSDSDTTEDQITKKSQGKRSTSPYGKTRRKRWSIEEKTAVNDHFGDPCILKNLPSLKECQQVIKKYPALNSRTPQQLKTWIDNQRKTLKRNNSKN